MDRLENPIGPYLSKKTPKTLLSHLFFFILFDVGKPLVALGDRGSGIHSSIGGTLHYKYISLYKISIENLSTNIQAIFRSMLFLLLDIEYLW